VQEDQQGQEQTRNDEQHLQPDLHSSHVSQTQSRSTSVRSHQTTQGTGYLTAPE
jgi:hypothetical protein